MPLLSELRFLVVDDMPSMRKIVIGQLRSLGATSILEAGDGMEAWKLLEQEYTTNPIHFIVCDWNMPEMKGIDLLKKCRTSKLFKDIGFLMLTAESEPKQVMDAVASRVDNYIVKPFLPANLDEKILGIYAKKFKGK